MALSSPATALITIGTVVMVASLPLVLRLVRPNRFYGIRLPAAFISEEHWYAINCYGGKRLLLFGMVVAGAGLLLRQHPEWPFWLPLLALFGTLLLLLLTVRAINRYAREME
ncbi:MAG: hypothetical protein BWK76_24050 [Desulfobulbaceae bacterium A2]|nr:MAG: hypothetical protein BWK76_24050 [Desulfobulbaceae bacterium A2]